MKKVIFTLICLFSFSLVFAYEPSAIEKSILEKIFTRLDQVAQSNPQKVETLKNNLIAIQDSFKNDERKYYIVTQVIAHIETTLSAMEKVYTQAYNDYILFLSLGQKAEDLKNKADAINQSITADLSPEVYEQKNVEYISVLREQVAILLQVETFLDKYRGVKEFEIHSYNVYFDLAYAYQSVGADPFEGMPDELEKALYYYDKTLLYTDNEVSIDAINSLKCMTQEVLYKEDMNCSK